MPMGPCRSWGNLQLKTSDDSGQLGNRWQFYIYNDRKVFYLPCPCKWFWQLNCAVFALMHARKAKKVRNLATLAIVSLSPTQGRMGQVGKSLIMSCMIGYDQWIMRQIELLTRFPLLLLLACSYCHIVPAYFCNAMFEAICWWSGLPRWQWCEHVWLKYELSRLTKTIKNSKIYIYIQYIYIYVYI